MESLRDTEQESVFLPGYKNYLVYCDDPGLHGSTHYAFGSLWMPWERRVDFVEIVRQLRERHRMPYAFKWTKVNLRYEAFYLDLVEMFFRRPWLTFHCLIVERAAIDKDRHEGDHDLARRKHFALLLQAKIRDLCSTPGGSKKRYHVRVDPLPSRYAKADQAAERIANSKLALAIGHRAERNSLLGSLRWLRAESISQAGQALADSLGDRHYKGLNPKAFFRRCYDVRSRLVHGAIPVPTREEVHGLAPHLESFVGDLLSRPVLGLVEL